jgi:hypothetical protein
MNLQHFLINAKQIAANKGTSLVHNLSDLQRQSLILASLVLVGSRIMIANVSAIKAKGTPEGPYRYRESIRTDIREICGWTGGFIVLRQLESAIKKSMADVLHIKEQQNPYKYSTWGAIKEWKENPALVVTKFKPDFTVDLTPTIDPKNYWAKMLVAKFKPNSMEAKDFIRQVYKFAPIGLASIPTVLLAGAYLERVTRDHSDHVVDFISQHLGSGAKAKGANPPVASAALLPKTPMPFPGTPPMPYNNRFTGMPSPAKVSPWQTPMPPRLPLGYSLGCSGR